MGFVMCGGEFVCVCVCVGFVMCECVCICVGFVMCGCACVCVCICGICNVWVYVCGFVMCEYVYVWVL